MTRTTRRRLLTGVGGAAAATAGCLGSEQPVTVLAAGSLQHPLQRHLAAHVDAPLDVEAHGSVRAARLVADDHRDPDLLALADTRLFEAVAGEPWHATFATNAVALAYSPDTSGGRAVADADRWFEPLLGGDIRLGRTDPDLDPLGYRTLFALELAAAHYDKPDLAGGILTPDQIYPETQVLAAIESGQLDAAFVYRSMAVDHDLPVVELPDAVDLSDPDRAYEASGYTLSDGTTVSPRPIRYGAVCRAPDDARASRVFDALVESAATTLDGTGLIVPPVLPSYVGPVPHSLR